MTYKLAEFGRFFANNDQTNPGEACMGTAVSSCRTDVTHRKSSSSNTESQHVAP